MVVSAAAAGPEEAKPRRPRPAPSSTRRVKQQVMQFLISAKWIDGEAKERGISATPDRGPAPVRADQEAVVPEREGLPALPRELRPDRPGPALPRAARRALRTRSARRSPRAATNVADGAIKNYYDKNAQQFSQPERRDLEVVLNKDAGQGASRPSSAVEGGTKWAKVAKRSLDRPRLEEPGRQAARRHEGSAGPAAFDAAIFAAVKNKIAGPIKTDAGYYVFRVTKVTPASKQSLEPVRSRASSSCSSRRTSRRSSTSSRRASAPTGARTPTAQPTYVIPDCRNGRESTQSTPTPTAPGQKKPVPGVHRRGAARTRRHRRLARGGEQERRRHGDRASTFRRAVRRARSAARSAVRLRRQPLALGGAPQKGGARPGDRVPPGLTQGGGAAGGAGGPGRRPAGGGAAPVDGRSAVTDRLVACPSGCDDALLELDADHPAAAPRLPVGPRAGRAQHRPAHGRRGLRARRRGALGRRRTSCSTSSATCSFRSISFRCCSRSAAPAISPRSPAGRPRKLVRRHPHVFGEGSAELGSLPTGPGPPPRFARTGTRSSRPSPASAPVRKRSREPAVAALRREASKARGARRDRRTGCRSGVAASWPRWSAPCPRRNADRDLLYARVGDLLFACVDLARSAGVDPEIALRRAAEGFRERAERAGSAA